MTRKEIQAKFEDGIYVDIFAIKNCKKISFENY